jgi:hypothetical protein
LYTDSFLTAACIGTTTIFKTVYPLCFQAMTPGNLPVTQPLSEPVASEPFSGGYRPRPSERAGDFRKPRIDARHQEFMSRAGLEANQLTGSHSGKNPLSQPYRKTRLLTFDSKNQALTSGSAN